MHQENAKKRELSCGLRQGHDTTKLHFGHAAAATNVAHVNSGKNGVNYMSPFSSNALEDQLGYGAQQ